MTDNPIENPAENVETFLAISPQKVEIKFPMEISNVRKEQQAELSS